MAFPDGWYRKVALTIDYTKVTGDQSNFPVALVWNGTTGNLPAEVYNDNGITSPCYSDGRDIRFSSDQFGKTELAFEIVTYSPNSTTANARVEIWVKLLSISSATNTIFYMWYKNPEAVAYGVTDTYGRNAVWSNSFIAVWHMNEGNAVDSTGNGYTGTDSGTDAATTILGTARGFVGASRDYISIGGTALLNSPATATIFALVNWTAADSNGSEILSLGDHLAIRLYSTTSFGFYYSGTTWYNTPLVATTILNAGLTSICYVCNPSASSQIIYCNGGGAQSTANAGAITYTGLAATTLMGRHGNAQTTSDFDGTMDEVRVSSVARSATWVTTEHNSTIGFATFFTAGTPEHVNGIRFDAVNSGSVAAGNNTITVAHTIGSGTNRLLMVGISWRDINVYAISSVKYNGVDMVLLNYGRTARSQAAIYYLYEASLPTAGTYNAVVTWAGNLGNEAILGTISFWGVDQIHSIKSKSKALGGVLYISDTITPEVDNSWIVDTVVGGGTGGSMTPDAGQTERWDVVNVATHGAGSTKIMGIAIETTNGWTNSASATGHVLILSAIAPHLPSEYGNQAVDHPVNRAFGVGINTGFKNY